MGIFKNWPAAQILKNFGPIPEGKYDIGGHTNSRGPLTITLTPQDGTIMHGRDLFRIHGDSRTDPGNASEGCIIVGRASRETIAKSKGSTLTVVR